MDREDAQVAAEEVIVLEFSVVEGGDPEKVRVIGSAYRMSEGRLRLARDAGAFGHGDAAQRSDVGLAAELDWTVLDGNVGSRDGVGRSQIR
jgi:hypothetical protein